MYHQLQIEIPTEVTQDATEEQMQQVVKTIMAYVGKELTTSNMKQIQRELRLLAGCSTALANGLNELQPKKH